MSNENANTSSFSHAFLPGLILGLVIGAVAGAFLPDLMGGSKIPPPTHEGSPSLPNERDGQPVPSQEEVDQATQDAIDAANEAANGAEQPEGSTQPQTTPPAHQPG